MQQGTPSVGLGFQKEEKWGQGPRLGWASFLQILLGHIGRKRRGRHDLGVWDSTVKYRGTWVKIISFVLQGSSLDIYFYKGTNSPPVASSRWISRTFKMYPSFQSLVSETLLLFGLLFCFCSSSRKLFLLFLLFSYQPICVAWRWSCSPLIQGCLQSPAEHCSVFLSWGVTFSKDSFCFW